MSTFDGERLRQVRRRRHVTQRQLGAAVGVDGRQVGYWELRRTVPSAQMIRALADALAVPPHALLTPVERPPRGLEHLRLAAGLSAAETAAAAGTTLARYRNLEAGRGPHTPSREFLRRIALALKTSDQEVEAAVIIDRANGSPERGN